MAEQFTYEQAQEIADRAVNQLGLSTVSLRVRRKAIKEMLRAYGAGRGRASDRVFDALKTVYGPAFDRARRIRCGLFRPQ